MNSKTSKIQTFGYYPDLKHTFLIMDLNFFLFIQKFLKHYFFNEYLLKKKVDSDTYPR